MSSIRGRFTLDSSGATGPSLGPRTFRHAETGCEIAADATLYYRDELQARLGLANADVHDPELILAAYLRWGEGCAEHLEGDFAFAIFDPREHKLFCARDRYAVRPFYYHFAKGKVFVFASDAREVLQDPDVPQAINEGRIADFIVPELQWIDYTSTFFEGVLRLPPAHCLSVTPSGMHIREYWIPQPGPELGLQSDEEYCEVFLDILSRAVAERIRVPGRKVGSMLSGGLDSGSIVGIAKDAVHPYSLAHLRGVDCQESQRIYATLDHIGLAGTQIIADDEDGLLEDPYADMAEPFDGEFVFLKAIYSAAKRDGIDIVLDGAAGDVVLNEGDYIQRLLRRGRFGQAWQETVAEQQFWEGDSQLAAFRHYLLSAFTPESLVKRPLRRSRMRHRERGYVDASLISPEFARRVSIEDRFDRMHETFSGLLDADPGLERVRKIRPNITAGRERYQRIAATVGSQARDPFTDQRVVDFCSRLPDDQVARNGWPKYLLRNAMAGKLPDAVRWGRGKPHIGWVYSHSLIRREISRGALSLQKLRNTLEGYVEPAKLRTAWEGFGQKEADHDLFSAVVLRHWLKNCVKHDIVKNQSIG